MSIPNHYWLTIYNDIVYEIFKMMVIISNMHGQSSANQSSLKSIINYLKKFINIIIIHYFQLYVSLTGEPWKTCLTSCTEGNEKS